MTKNKVIAEISAVLVSAICFRTGKYFFYKTALQVIRA